MDFPECRSAVAPRSPPRFDLTNIEPRILFKYSLQWLWQAHLRTNPFVYSLQSVQLTKTLQLVVAIRPLLEYQRLVYLTATSWMSRVNTDL